jgi:hypothetical protein
LQVLFVEHFVLLELLSNIFMHRAIRALQTELPSAGLRLFVRVFFDERISPGYLVHEWVITVLKLLLLFFPYHFFVSLHFFCCLAFGTVSVNGEFCVV